MDDPEIYWKIVSVLHLICIMAGAGFCFYCFVKPFLIRKKYAWCVGAAYFACMVFLYFAPFEFQNFTAYGMGVLTAFIVMCALDFRNIGQKIFLAVTFFLLRWISRGLTASIYSVLSETLFQMPQLAAADLKWQFAAYVVITIFSVVINFLFIWIAVRLILWAYVYKREDMAWRELLLHIVPSMSIVAGWYAFQFCETVYEADTGRLMEEAYGAYHGIKNLYQSISFAAILVMILMYQNIKNRQWEEKQNELLAGQMEEMKRHIREVEKLYLDIRSLRHDMGNHVMTLENLCLKNERDEAVKYVAALREQLSGTGLEVKSGNPVTDVILTEKRKEAQEGGIAFTCAFVYPEGERINAFDVSVILNNALSNAMEAAVCCENPYIQITSCRENNAYMIEIKNSFSGVLDIDEENGMPVSIKREQGHGFGLANIRRVAQKYYGDIDIRYDEACFYLTVMLMLE